MRTMGILAGGFLLLGTVLCFAQEESLTITTYYPSPYGVYQDVEVYSNMTYKDQGGGGTRLRTYTDASGDLHLNSTVSDYQIIFDSADSQARGGFLSSGKYTCDFLLGLAEDGHVRIPWSGLRLCLH